MTYKLLISLAVLAAAACAPRYEWARSDTPAGETELAQQECSQEAGAYNFLDGPDQSVRVVTARGERYANLNANTAAREFSLFNECMHAKGYFMAPVDETGVD
jgi:hypothetical protein